MDDLFPLHGTFQLHFSSNNSSCEMDSYYRG